jgi:hypothetical protein
MTDGSSGVERPDEISGLVHGSSTDESSVKRADEISGDGGVDCPSTDGSSGVERPDEISGDGDGHVSRQNASKNPSSEDESAMADLAAQYLGEIPIIDEQVGEELTDIYNQLPMSEYNRMNQ